VAGASIPYPVNYIINFIVIILFAIVILAIASYRYYKSRAARAQRQMLTGRQCLNLNMAGVMGRYPPKKIKRMLELNELQQLKDADAAQKEYEIENVEVKEEQSNLKTDEKGSDVVQDHTGDSVAKAPAMSQDKPHAPDVKRTAFASEVTIAEPVQAEEGIVPTFILPDEENIETGGDVTEGNVQADALPDESNIGQSENNGAKQDSQHPPEATSTTTATQTKRLDAEPKPSSVEGSFDDSV